MNRSYCFYQLELFPGFSYNVYYQENSWLHILKQMREEITWSQQPEVHVFVEAVKCLSNFCSGLAKLAPTVKKRNKTIWVIKKKVHHTCHIPSHHRWCIVCPDKKQQDILYSTLWFDIWKVYSFSALWMPPSLNISIWKT